MLLFLAQGAAFAATGVKAQPVFKIQRVYLKQLALEQPNSPAIFLESDAPKVEVKVDIGSSRLNSSKLESGVYETWIDITVTLKVKGKIALLLKGRQAGIFDIQNVPADQISSLLGVGCTNIVYPYLRANLADAITRAGFPPVHLAEVNWEDFYKKDQLKKTGSIPFPVKVDENSRP
ncbi:MAG: protein-export chaperone SecB [Pseudomonadota bacterium]